MNRRLWIGSLVILAAIGFVLFKGLGDATVFFKTADQAVSEKSELGSRRFRVEGTVVTEPKPEGKNLVFTIENNGARVPVVHSGDQPAETFRLGIPVVLEGRWSGEHYASDRIMVKHTESYRTKQPERVKDYPAET